MDAVSVDVGMVRAAARRISGLAVRTPARPSAFLSREAARPVWLKLETAQPTGSFKIRGAANRILAAPPADAARGVVAASTGNHGRAVAHVARALGIPATVVLSGLVPAYRRAAIADLGARLVVAGRDQAGALARVAELVRADGALDVPPFDDPLVIAGQGTIGLELAAQVPDPFTVLVPLSGGGLAAGIAVAVKALLPGTRVVGVSMERGAAMAASLRAGRPVEVEEAATLADSLGGGIGHANRYTFRLVRDLVDGVVLVSEQEIARGMRELWLGDGVVAEGAGAVGAAALLAGKVPLPADGGAVAVVVSGGNVDPSAFRSAVSASPGPGPHAGGP